MYVLQEPDRWNFDRVGVRGKVFPADQLADRTEHLIIETDRGHETTIIERECDFIYYVLEGEGYFVIDGEREDCDRGDLIVVPHGTPFTYRGRLRMLLSCTPPFYPEQESVVSAG